MIGDEMLSVRDWQKEDGKPGLQGAAPLSSKLRKLKQQAYEAGRKRDWSGAAEAYAQILELDKNNPSVLNEYGDLCLKAGDATKAVRQFLVAASRYKQTGLLNNAQAVYKKVLRHDADNLNAHWFLAEIRSSQGLIGDGEQHALKFLSAAEDVSGEIKEIFLKRCLELFELYPESDPILERVEGIFRIWDMGLEAARTGLLRACVAHDAGQTEEAAKSVADITAAHPELANYAEFTRWQTKTGKADAPAGFNDFNTVSLGADEQASAAAAPTPTPAPAPEPQPDPVPEATIASAAKDNASAFDDFLTSGGELETTDTGSPFAADEAGPAEPDPEPTSVDPEDETVDVEKDDDGCISIDLDDESSFAELLGDAEESLTIPAAESTESMGGVNLLDEILAEEGEDILRSSETEQVSTIASEIGRNVGETGEADPEMQYQQGLVYLEMGLYDQAALAFTAASDDPAHALQAREMWGHALHRDGRSEEALAVLQDGLDKSEEGSTNALGLRYHAGRILEELDRHDEAQAHYRKVLAADAGFADVARRLHTSVS